MKLHCRPFIMSTTALVLVMGLVSGCSQTTNNSSSNSVVTSSSALNVQALKPVGMPTKEEKQTVFDEVWGLFEQHYPSFKMKVVNWKREKVLFEPPAIAATSWQQFFSVLSTMIDTLHDYHSGLVNEPIDAIYTPAIATDYVDNELVVIAAPQSKTIRPGMVVLGVNGVSVNNFMDGIGGHMTFLPDFFAPIGPQTENIFDEGINKPETVTVYNPQNGNVLSDTLHVYRSQTGVWNQFNRDYPVVVEDFSEQLSPSLREMANGLLYIKIPSMDPSLQQYLQNHMSEIAKAKGLIIDLRDNGGGNSAPGSWFAQHFYSVPTAALEVRYSANLAWVQATLQPLSPHISIPTAVLINSGDASSAEMFIAQLEVAPNVVTFGTRTTGMDGDPQIYPVMEGVQVKISSWQERTTSTGLPIEQFGIAPNYEINESYPDFIKELLLAYHSEDASKYDDVLQNAVTWVTSKIQINK